MPYQVPISMHPLLSDPLFLVVLIWLATAIGHRVLCWLRVDIGALATLEHGVLASALGIGLLQFVPLGLGAAGVLTPTALWIAMVGVMLLFCRDVLRVATRMIREVRRGKILPSEGWIRIGIVLLLFLLAVLFVNAMAPPNDADGLYYHLTGPKRWLQTGHIGYLPTLLHTNMPMGIQMLYTVALGIWSDTSAIGIHYSLGVLALLAIFALGCRIHSPSVGFCVVILFLVGVPTSNARDLFTYAYTDLGITLQVTCALLAWIIWKRQGDQGLLRCAALCAGFAATCKMTVALVGIVLGVLTFITLCEEGRPRREALRFCLVLVLLSLLPILPWLLRSFLLTGNPVYPVLSGVVPSRDWRPEAGRAFETFFRYYVWGTGSGSLHGTGRRKLLLLGAAILILGGTGLWVWRDRDRGTRALIIAAALLCLLCLWSTGLYLRYLLPTLPLIYVACLSKVGDRLVRSVPAQGFLLLVLGVQCLLAVRAHPLRDAIRVAVGSMPRDTYLDQAFKPMPLWRYVNAHVPRDAHVLLVAGRPSYYMDPYCYVSEAVYQNCIRQDTWEHYLSDLRREHIEYLIVPAVLESYSLGFDYTPTLNERPFAARLAREYGTKLYSCMPDSLYRLDLKSSM